jgi:hypothetical protein
LAGVVARAASCSAVSAQTVAGLRRDDRSGAAACDDVSELFERHRGSVEVYSEDRVWRRLAGRNVCGVDIVGLI